jgi:exodeoxyribonuclease VII large subunit
MTMTANFFEFQEKLRKPPNAPPPMSGGDDAALSVSQLTAKIVKVLNSGMPSSVLVRGEVSNFKPNRASGHLYFTLKDAEACLDCVMFRSEAARLKFEPADGMELLAGGRVGVYPARGRYQLYVNTLRPLGQGALELAFQQMRKKLEAEGLFDAERKRPLPAYPLRIVIITSREAAALQDILKVLRRFSWLQLALYPVPVQGEGASAKIAAAITHLNDRVEQTGGADLILLARGGGALEDLWAFNEEAVARAIAASRIPIVTGIGHEVDVSIADLVADHHAHTPTEAAQVITAHWRGVRDRLDENTLRLARALRGVVSNSRARLRAIERHEAFRRPLDQVNMLRQLLDDRQRAMLVAEDRLLRDRRDRIYNAGSRLQRFLPSVLIRFSDVLSARKERLERTIGRQVRSARDRMVRAAGRFQERHPRLRFGLAVQQIQATEERLDRAVSQQLKGRILRLDALARQLEAVSPQSVLRRGYTITILKKGGTVLRSAQQVKPGDKLLTRFADGAVESIAEDSKQLSLFD